MMNKNSHVSLLKIVMLSLGLLLVISCAHTKYPTFDQELDFALFAAKRGLWEEARFRFENLLRMQPDNAQIHNNLAVAYEALKNYEKAEQEYIRALKLAPDNEVIKKNYQQLTQILKEKVVEP